jgi:hypothetical protein
LPFLPPRLKHAQTQNIRKPDQSLVIQIEQIQNEIKHLETGRDQKMIEAVKDSQQKTWEAYEEVRLVGVTEVQRRDTNIYKNPTERIT